MKLFMKAGATSQMVYVFIADSTSTTGAGKTGLVFNTASLVWTYAKSDDGNVAGTAVTLATMTKGTWATGGFVEKDATLLPGVYQISIPNAAISTGTNTIMVLRGATGMADCRVELQLTAVDFQSATAFMTSVATVTTVTNQLTAAAIATGVWQDATAGDFTTASSIGKSLYTSGVAPGGTNGLFIAGTNAATTITTALTTTFTGNLTGSVASVTGAVGSVTAGVTIANGGLPAAGFGVGAIDGAAMSTAAGNVIADALLGRNVAGGSSTGRVVKEALYTLRNKSSIAAGVVTFTQTDDTTSAFTANIVTTAGNPITSFAPTS